MTVRFGYGLITCQRYPGDARSDVDLHAEALGAAEEAERLGFDSVWTSEHHFADDSYAPSLLPLSAAMAARTSRIQIGTGLVLAPLYHPIRLAEDVAVVDLISGGRFVLGLGQGWLRWEFEALGAPFGQRGRRIQEVIQTCRRAWGNGLLEAAGWRSFPGPRVRAGRRSGSARTASPPSAVRPLSPTGGLRANPTRARSGCRWSGWPTRYAGGHGRRTSSTWRATGPCSRGPRLGVPGRWCGHFITTCSGSTWMPNGRGGPRAASAAPGSQRAIGGRAACGNHLRRPGRGCRPRRRTRGHRPRRRATLHVHRAHALPRHGPRDRARGGPPVCRGGDPRRASAGAGKRLTPTVHIRMFVHGRGPACCMSLAPGAIARGVRPRYGAAITSNTVGARAPTCTLNGPSGRSLRPQPVSAVSLPVTVR
jgi:Luciferase-like monooxygenase